MKTTRLGRTGLNVSVAGLGCGGHSRLGLGQGKPEANAVAIVSEAVEHGVTLIDTAQVYGTERAVGEAVAGRRERVVISTKGQIVKPGTSALGRDYRTGDDLRRSVEASLKTLATDYIDIFHLHGVMPNQYQPCRDRFVPVLEDLRREGKIRFFGLTERFIHDPGHDMLQAALGDDHWDVVMVGFNMINQSARDRVLPLAENSGAGVLCMFAVRNFLSSNEAAAGLTGTGNPDHLKANLVHLAGPPLADAIRGRLIELFGHIDQVSGE
jgi:aryl-alcohol dehydrogenase-like predicted oxidoreductase